MGYFCPECGSEDKPGTKYQVTKGGKMLPDDPDYATKYKKGEIWVVHQSSIGLQLLKNNRIGILNAPRLIRYGIETGKLKEMEIPSTSNASMSYPKARSE